MIWEQAGRIPAMSAGTGGQGATAAKVRQALSRFPRIAEMVMLTANQVDPQILTVNPWQGGSGNVQTRLLYQPVDGNRNASGAIGFSLNDVWTLDLNASTLDVATLTGGVIDGSGPLANADYFIWAFWFREPSSRLEQFAGFGMTLKPQSVGQLTGPGIKGTTEVFTVAAGDAYKHTAGARVIVRDSALFTSTSWNQGTIVSVDSAGQLTIMLDNDPRYGFNLTALTNHDIVQVDRFEPALPTDPTRFPGSGIEYFWQYVGHVQTRVNAEIESVRQWGPFHSEPYMFPADAVPQVMGATTLTGVSATAIPLYQWIPSHVRRVLVRLDATAPSPVSLLAGPSIVGPGEIAISAGDAIQGHGWSRIALSGAGMTVQTTDGGGPPTGTLDVFLLGWSEEMMF